MIQKTNALVLGWVQVTDSSGRTHLEAQWFEARQADPVAPVVHAA